MQNESSEISTLSFRAAVAEAQMSLVQRARLGMPRLPAEHRAFLTACQQTRIRARREHWLRGAIVGVGAVVTAGGAAHAFALTLPAFGLIAIALLFLVFQVMGLGPESTVDTPPVLSRSELVDLLKRAGGAPKAASVVCRWMDEGRQVTSADGAALVRLADAEHALQDAVQAIEQLRQESAGVGG